MTRKLSLCLLALFLGVAVLRAQPEAVKETSERRSPLPNYFGKLAVDDVQRSKLYQIQDDYAAKIDVLQQQVRALIKERDGRMEELLTEGQKLRLKELRAEARLKAADRKDQDEPAAEENAADPK